LGQPPGAMSKSSGPRSKSDRTQWLQHVHQVQSQRTPEACQAAKLRIEQSRIHESSMRKCKAVKGHAIRSRALAAEGLKQMAKCSAPQQQSEVQERWRSAQAFSSRMQDEAVSKADMFRSEGVGEVQLLGCAEEREEAMMEGAAQLVGAEDVGEMAAVGAEGVNSQAAGGAANMADLLSQLRVEPEDAAECAAKFGLYEGYSSEVEQMRNNLVKFHGETRPTVPAAIGADMDKQIRNIDSAEAMGIADDLREWFVYHMMRQAERNNLRMASILDGFEKKLEFLASNDQAECPVCLEAFDADEGRPPETLACCHKVCKQCWDHWSAVRSGRPFCPLCRQEDFLGAIVEAQSVAVGRTLSDSE